MFGIEIEFAEPGAGVLSDPAILIAALLVDWIIGDMRWLFRFVPHPVVLIGGLTGFFDRKLNRDARSDINRTIRGAVMTVIVGSVAAAAGWGLARGLHSLPYGWGVEIILVAILLAQRSLAGRTADVGRALRRGDEQAARDGLKHLCSRDPKSLDRPGVARAAIESLSENFSDAVVAPAFWFAILGLPGLFAYKAINTMDSMVGYKTEKYLAFGMTAAKTDDAVNWIPARLAGLLIVIAAVFIPTGRPVRALKTIARDAPKHASPNAGWPEAAMAGALDFALGGPRHYAGEAAKTTWIGSGRARLDGADIGRAVVLYVVACFLLLITIAPLAVATPLR
ncbi:MAG: adenosylcobinamide-phosphate synthase CbiB [Alphaproteobacteria bacterium]